MRKMVVCLTGLSKEDEASCCAGIRVRGMRSLSRDRIRKPDPCIHSMASPAVVILDGHILV